ncbi:MAG: hypothetical protein MK213_03390, partial [Planctomycetes bacterium]|nr:hypothetical protein [Planctomycetota bacterium]
VEVQLGGQPFWNWLGPLVGLLPWGMLGLKRMDPSTRWGLLGFLGLAGLCVLLIRLPWGNEYKFARLGALLWVIPAARGLEHFSEHRKHVPWLCLGAFLPTAVLCAHAAVTWAESAKSTPPLVLTKGSVEWDPALGYQPTVDWLRHSETSAVLLVDPGEWGAPGSLQGNPWAAVVPQALAVDFLHVHNEGQPDLEARLADAFAVYRSKDSVKVLAGLESMRAEFAGRVLLVLDAQGRPELSSVFEQEGGQRVVGSDGNAPQLWKFQPPASGN